GRAKDLIIRGGHNIDPAEIEEAMMGHPAVAFVGAVGQPDAFAGELPCAYVELVKGAEATAEELTEYARTHIHERAAVPKHVEILPELPKTAVGKIFKPDLRKLAIRRVYDAALAEAGLAVLAREVFEDKKRGLVARIECTGSLAEPVLAVPARGAFEVTKRGRGARVERARPVDKVALRYKLGDFTPPWDWAEWPRRPAPLGTCRHAEAATAARLVARGVLSRV